MVNSPAGIKTMGAPSCPISSFGSGDVLLDLGRDPGCRFPGCFPSFEAVCGLACAGIGLGLTRDASSACARPVVIQTTDTRPMSKGEPIHRAHNLMRNPSFPPLQGNRSPISLM